MMWTLLEQMRDALRREAAHNPWTRKLKTRSRSRRPARDL